MKGKLLQACLKKWRKGDGIKSVHSSACKKCYEWMCPLAHKNKTIPKDVPKGHLVVYVGECKKRFVIKIALLKHPLFKALLDQAQEVYDFTADTKLCIPCDENIFTSVLRCATSPQNQYCL